MRTRELIFVVSLVLLCTMPTGVRPASATYPYWLTGWDYRKSVSITGATGAGTDYPVLVNVTYETGMQSNFADVRFTDNDAATELSYWLEEYVNESYGVFWVKVTDSLESSAAIYEYWGNDEVSTTSNGHNVFYFFDDFETGDLTDYWQTVQAAWSTVTSEKVHGARAAFADSSANRELSNDNDIDETGVFDGSNDLMFHAWVRMQSVAGDEYFCYLTDSDSTVYAGLVNLNDYVTYTTAAGVIPYVSNCFVTHTWYELEIGVDFTNTELVPYVDGTPGTVRTLQDKTSSAVDLVDKLTVYCDPSANRDLWIDDYYCRKWVAGDCSVDSFGETETGPSWHEVSPAQLYFDLLTGFLSGWFILAGMIMIPVSTLYLVKGGRDELSMDKIFLTLVIFFLGLALFIGGIMP